MPKLWLFDLDDTLFEASGGMLHKIHLLMNEYMCRELGMEWEEASVLRRHYWSVYGATFLGLWRHHGIDPRDFLSFAHDFDPRLYIQFSGCPAEDVKRLPGRKVVFTNGPRNYARAVLEALELDHVVDGLVASTDMHALGQWRPKPSRLMFLMTCRRWGVSPADTVFVDDSPMNLMAAHAERIRTVWCTGYRKKNGKLANRIVRPCADFTIGHIRELSRLQFGTPDDRIFSNGCLNVLTHRRSLCAA